MNMQEKDVEFWPTEYWETEFPSFEEFFGLIEEVNDDELQDIN